MLNHVDAALSTLWEARSCDRLAELAEVCLGAAVVIVVPAPPAPVLGAGERARAAVHDLAAVPATPVALPAAEPLLGGGATGLEPPFDRGLRVPLGAAGAGAELRVFPSAEGICASSLARVADVLARSLDAVARAEARKADLLRFRRMVSHLERAGRIGVWELALGEGTLFWSDELFRIFGRVPGPPPALAEALDHYPEPGRSVLREALAQAEATGDTADLVLPLVSATGEQRLVRVVATRVSDGAGGRWLTGIVQDVTTQEAVTERLWWTANHDSLTGLPNRGLFADRFRKALQRQARTGGLVLLVVVDVDRFKKVNDSLGHAAGDEVLRLVGRRLKEVVRGNDTVARSGGDEFSVLLEDLRGDDVEVLARRVSEALSVRLVTGEQTTIVTMSAGAAIAPQHGGDTKALYAAADMALYRAKEMRRGDLVVFEPSFVAATNERNRLLAAVRVALDEGRIVPYYQPQVDVVSGRIVGVEALARWIAEDGVHPAADFIAAMSDHELGARIGAAVVDRAIVEVAALNAGRQAKIALSVNASAGELARLRFLDRIGRARADGAAAGPITVEIREDVILDDPDGTVAESLAAVRASGVRFSLDNAGADFASLVTVATVPISEVKIDRRFTAGLAGDAEKQKVLRGIIDAARALGLRVIVEGVETAAQVDEITALGGRVLQGFYYSRAVPLEELERLLVEDDGRLNAAA